MVQNNTGAPVVVTNTVAVETEAGNTVATSTNQELLIAAIGTPTDAAWNGTAPAATVISLLKAIAMNTSTT